MNQEYLDFMASYLDKIGDAQNFDPEEMDYNRYVYNLFDIIIEIGNVKKKHPEIKSSVFLHHILKIRK